MNPFILLVVGAVGLAGCVILLLLGLNMLREERGSKEGAAETSAPVSSAGAPAGSAAMAPALEAGKPDAARPAGGGVGGAFAGVTARFSGNAARGNAHEVLRVLRDNLTGRLSLEIAGKRYPSLDDVRDDEVRQALMTTLQDLQAFAGGTLSAAAAEQPTEAAAPSASAIVRSVAASRAARPTAEAAAAPAAEYKPLPPPSMNPFKQMAVLREIAKNPPPEPKSITEQIDDVLQERIIGTPLIHRNLHVRPGPRGDALFEADGQSYASVDELPDVEVRDAIKAAIVEWEKSR